MLRTNHVSFAQESAYGVFALVGRELRGRRPGDNHDGYIVPQMFSQMPIGLTNAAFDPIANDCVSNFAGNRHPELASCSLAPGDVTDERPIRDAFAMFVDVFEVNAASQTFLLGNRF